MSGFILGKKISQSQSFTEDGRRIPQTTIKTSPCYLIDIKTKDKHGYFALKLGTGTRKNIKKPVQGELKKVGINTPLSFLKELRLERYGETINYIEEDGKKGIKIGEKKIFIGEEVTPDLLLNVGDLVDVSGVSKGKGFQGVVKRHHFAGGPRTHGQSDRERAPGSIGQTTTPGRVYKGKRMAGRMGGERVTVKNLPVIKIDKDQLVVKGLVPGAVNSWLEIKTIK
jgi:large subunit ribosomal protein L3